MRKLPLVPMDMRNLAAREHGTSTGLQQLYINKMDRILIEKLVALVKVIEHRAIDAAYRTPVMLLYATNLMISATACPYAIMHDQGTVDEREVVDDTVTIASQFSINFCASLSDDQQSTLRIAASEVTVAAVRALGATGNIAEYIDTETTDGITTFYSRMSLEKDDILVCGRDGDQLRSLRRNRLTQESSLLIVPDDIVPSLREMQESLPRLCGQEVCGFAFCRKLKALAAAHQVDGGGLGVAYEFKTGFSMFSFGV